MRYWNQKNFEGLLEIADSIRDRPDWHGFESYCRLREKGLRKQALEELNRFVAQVVDWSFDRRRELVDWLLWTRYRGPEVHWLIAFPLEQGVIQPTLLEWTIISPTEPTPHRWLGWYFHGHRGRGWYFRGNDSLWRAIELGDDTDIPRSTLINRLIRDIEYATHHLPHYFIGDPEQCLVQIEI